MVGKGPYTIFVPHADYLQKTTTFAEWEKAGCIKDLLRYHTVICQMLLSDDLESQDSITALSGHKIRVSVKENSLYLNDEVKIIESDITRENGVIHFIDGILAPYDLQHHSIPCNQSEKTIIEVAEAHGYNIYSKLLKETGLLNLVNNTLHQPFTMLWPTDEAFNSLPAEMQQWLYHKDHRSKLSAYLKGHMVRDIKVLASKLTELSSLRTLHGSTISFSCSKTNAGDIVVDNGNAKIVQRYMEFNVGIAYGTDHLLEPPDLGSRCDEFQTVEISHSLDQGSPTLDLWPSTIPRYASNWSTQTSEAPSMGCNQHAKPRPLQSMEKPFSTELVRGAKNVGSAALDKKKTFS
ncbi:PREDICTED: stabilin-1-like [Thamnophis sirtalis]|uniref:Stabilin-1-like n=1 Tax=Thamnophis sirtalis TaxID=35019 RepID=A0A6I9YDJ2_9SAUR|nr:PREDICTED: stabilin-1-like [Thamnophis sirtalis]